MSFQGMSDEDGLASLVGSELVANSESAGATASEYEGDDFEGYSDEFESDSESVSGGSDVDSSKPGATTADRTTETNHPAINVSNAMAQAAGVLWGVGDRIQVYWDEDDEWFDGEVATMDASTQKCFVHYSDGEQAWENSTHLRLSPPVATSVVEQFQLIVAAGQPHHIVEVAHKLIRRRVLVYWEDEMSWFSGSLTACDPVRGVHVQYDDDDDQWIPQAEFRNVLLFPLSTDHQLDRATTVSTPSVVHSVTTPPTPNNGDRTLTPRLYHPVVGDHIKRVRTARPYQAVVSNHTSSILIPRSPYTPRRILHSVTLDCVAMATISQPTFDRATMPTRECMVQTDILSATSA